MLTSELLDKITDYLKEADEINSLVETVLATSNRDLNAAQVHNDAQRELKRICKDRVLSTIKALQSLFDHELNTAMQSS